MEEESKGRLGSKMCTGTFKKNVILTDNKSRMKNMSVRK